MKKNLRQFLARLWAKQGLIFNDWYQEIRESVFDAMDESTGAGENIRFLQAENESLTRAYIEVTRQHTDLCRENEALKTLLAEQMRETIRFAELAERYRSGSQKLHTDAARYRRQQRCDALAKALYAQNVPTRHGTLPSTALN